MGEITTRDGTALHVEESYGGGRPVVLIHGWPLSGQSWEGQVGALVDEGYRVITYDRRGFGRSDKPPTGFDYDTLAADLDDIATALDLRDLTLVGFSMGGGEVARYIANHGEDRLDSIVLASAVTPYMLQTEDNPFGPLTPEEATQMKTDLETDREAFFDEFTRAFYSVADELKVTEAERQKSIEWARQSDPQAALACMESFGGTDFRGDLDEITVPALVIHGDSDDIVPVSGSAERTQEQVRSSSLQVISGAPHGLLASHTAEFNQALLGFLAERNGDMAD